MPVLHISINPKNHGAVVGFSTDDYITEHGISDTMKKNFLNVRTDATDEECKTMIELIPVEAECLLETSLDGVTTTLKVGPGEITEYVPQTGTLTIHQEGQGQVDVDYTSHDSDKEFTIDSKDFNSIPRGVPVTIPTGVSNHFTHEVDTDPLVAVEDRARMLDRAQDSPTVSVTITKLEVPKRGR